jgi:hypothetical protein
MAEALGLRDRLRIRREIDRENRVTFRQRKREVWELAHEVAEEGGTADEIRRNFRVVVLDKYKHLDEGDGTLPEKPFMTIIFRLFELLLPYLIKWLDSITASGDATAFEALSLDFDKLALEFAA